MHKAYLKRSFELKLNLVNPGDSPAGIAVWGYEFPLPVLVQSRSLGKSISLYLEEIFVLIKIYTTNDGSSVERMDVLEFCSLYMNSDQCIHRTLTPAK